MGARKPPVTARSAKDSEFCSTASATENATTATSKAKAAAGGNTDKGTVGIAMPTKSSERWVADGKNMVDQFQALGYATDLQYGDDVVQNQVSQIENMITKGVKVLVIAPIDGSSLTTTLQHAADAKIPVISYDRLIKGTPSVDYYATMRTLYLERRARLIEDRSVRTAGLPDF